MFPTQLAPTPRGFPSGTPLYAPAVRARLLRSFHDAFASSFVISSRELQGIEAVLLSNSVSTTDFNHPIFLVSTYFRNNSVDSLPQNAYDFVADILAFTHVTEENKPWRTVIRSCVTSIALDSLMRDSTDVFLEKCTKLLLVDSLDAFIEEEDLKLVCSLIRNRVKNSVELAVKLIQKCTEPEFLVIQGARSEINILLALADQVLISSFINPQIIDDPPEVLAWRAKALHAISIALSLTTDPTSLLLLRRDQTEQTVCQKAFSVFFQQLIYEDHRRKMFLHDNHGEMRISCAKDALSILTRAGALQTGSVAFLLDECACLVPFLIGIVRSLVEKLPDDTSEFHEYLKTIPIGELMFIKGLGAPSAIGTCSG
jgi:hypothetical protein